MHWVVFACLDPSLKIAILALGPPIMQGNNAGASARTCD